MKLVIPPEMPQRRGRGVFAGVEGASLVYWIAHTKGNRLKPLVQRRTREEGNSLPFWVILSSLLFHLKLLPGFLDNDLLMTLCVSRRFWIQSRN